GIRDWSVTGVQTCALPIFETLCKEFRIRDAKVQAIAQIVHDADLEDDKFGRNEGAGLDRVLVGWAKQDVSDDELLRRGMQLIERSEERRVGKERRCRWARE